MVNILKTLSSNKGRYAITLSAGLNPRCSLLVLEEPLMAPTGNE